MAGIAGMGTPEALKPPVPGEADQNTLDQSLNVKLPQMQTPQAAPQDDLEALFAQHAAGADQPQGDLESLFSQHGGSEMSPEDAQAQADSQEKGFFATNFTPSGIADQLSSAGVRTKAGFAKTDKEKRFVLDQAYGADNVKKAKDGFLIKKDGKWQSFDHKTFELIGDIADMGRETVEASGSMIGTGVAAGLAGAETIGTGGVGAVAAPAIVAAGGAAGAAAGTGAADLIQAGLGIPRDPERSAAKEYATSAALGGVFSGVGALIEGKLARRAAASKLEEALAPEVNAGAAAQDAVEVATRLRDEHQVIGNIPGTDTPILPSQANLLSQQARAHAEELSSAPAYQGAVKATGDMVSDGFQKVADGFSNYSGARDGTGAKFISGANAVTKAEGTIIGNWRQKAMDATKGADIEVPGLADKVRQIASDLGMQVKDNKLVIPTVDELTQMGYSERGANLMIKNVQSLEHKLYNQESKMSIKELDGLYKQWSGIINNTDDLRRAGDGSYRQLLQVKNAIRDSYTEAIGNALGDVDKKQYTDSLAKFTGLKDAAGKLTNVLDKDEITSNALAKSLFSKSGASLDKIQAAKTLIEDQDPAVWRDVVGQHLSDLIAKNTKPATASSPISTNWTAVQKDLNSLGPEVLNEMIPAESRRAFDDVLKYGSNVFQGSNGFTGEGAQRGIVAKVVGGLAQFITKPKTASLEFLSNLDSEKLLLKTLSKNGVDSVVKLIPKNDQGKARILMNQYVKYGQNRAAQAAGLATRSGVESMNTPKQ